MATYRSELYVPVEFDQRSFAQHHRDRQYSQPYGFCQSQQQLQGQPQPPQSAPHPQTHYYQVNQVHTPGPATRNSHQRYPSVHQSRSQTGTMSNNAFTSTAASGFGTFGRPGTSGSLSGAKWFDARPSGSILSGGASGLNGFDDSFGACGPQNLTGNGDVWYDEMRRRFDERKRVWDEDIQRMRDEFFTLLPRDSSWSSGSTLNRRGAKPALPNESQAVSTSYERAADGHTHFVARFEVSDFAPELVRVSVRQNQIVVIARYEQRSGSSASSREFTRSVDLPRTAVETQITATVTADGILVVDCPLRSGDQPATSASSLGGGGGGGGGGSHVVVGRASPSPLSTTQVTRDSRHGGAVGLHPGGSGSSVTFGRQSPAFGGNLIHPSVAGGSIGVGAGSGLGSGSLANPRFHLEIPIGTDYLPTEIQIRTLNQRVYINARHEERSASRTAFREFSKEYDIPENVDPQTVEARLENGILHIEAAQL